MASSCEHCGTSTGTHWPNCPHYMGPRPKALDSPISQRSNGEKNSYIQGFEAALKLVKEGKVEVADESLKIMKQVL